MTNRNKDLAEQVTQELRFDGGVNTLHHPLAISPIQCQRAANVFPNKNGIIEKRPGVEGVASVLMDNTGGSPNTIYVLNVYCPDASTGWHYAFHILRVDAAGNGIQEYIVFREPFAFQDEQNFSSNSQYVQLNNGKDESGNYVTTIDTDPVCAVNYFGKMVMVGGGVMRDGSYQREVIHTPGNNVPGSLIKASFVHIAGTGIPDNQSQSIPVQPKVACTYRGRMRYFDFGPGMENWMVSADFAKPGHTNTREAPIFTVVGNDVLASNGRYFPFDQAQGERITCGREVMLQALGSPMDTALMVLTNKSCFICTGDITQTSDDTASIAGDMFGDFKANKVNYTVGCASDRTCVQTPYGYIWASGTDVWTLQGNVPTKIGTLITNELAKCPEDCHKWWTAAYCDNKYILQVVTTRGTDDRFLQRQQWWLDLSNGIPPNWQVAEWFGPMSVVRDAGEDSDHCYLSGIAYDPTLDTVIGCATNKLIGPVVGYNHQAHIVDYLSEDHTDDIPFTTVTGAASWYASTDFAVGDIVRPSFLHNNGRLYVCTTAGTSDTSEPNWPNTDGGTVIDGTVTWTEILGTSVRLLNQAADTQSLVNCIDITSKEFTLNYPNIDKILKRIELYAASEQLQTLWLNCIRNQGADVQFNVLVAAYGQNSGFNLGQSALDSNVVSNLEFEGKSLRPKEGHIIRGKSFSVRVRDGYDSLTNPNRDAFQPGGYLIDETCNALVFGYFNTAGQWAIYQADITLDPDLKTAKFFANIEALTAAVATAMNAAVINLSDLVGFTGAAPRWTATTPHSANFPYFNGLKYDFVGRGANNGSVALLFGDTNDYDLTPYGNITGASTVDLKKSQKLMSIMGFSTERNYDTGAVNGASGPLFGTDVYYSPENQVSLSTSPAIIYAKQITPYQRSAKIALHMGVMYARSTHNKPLTRTNR